jgi:hypothetical protein
MAEEGVPYRADTGGGVSNAPDLRAPLGQRIATYQLYGLRGLCRSMTKPQMR